MSASRRAAVLSLAAALLLVAPAVASAPVTPKGDYKGKTKDGQVVILGVTTKKKVLGGGSVNAKCSLGSQAIIQASVPSPGVKLKGRSFSSTSTSKRATNLGLQVTTATIKGTFNRKATKVTGSIKGTLQQGVPGQSTPVTCSGKTSFTAKKVVKAKSKSKGK